MGMTAVEAQARKLEAKRLLLEENLRPSQIGARLGVSTNSVRVWMRQLRVKWKPKQVNQFTEDLEPSSKIEAERILNRQKQKEEEKAQKRRGPTDLPEPLEGTFSVKEMIQTYQKRVRAGQSLFHPEDRVQVSDKKRKGGV